MRNYNIDELKQQVKHVLEYSQDLCGMVSDSAIEEILTTWEQNKGPFIDSFMNGELIIELPGKRSFHLGEKAKTKKYNDFLDYLVLRLNNYELCRFVETQGVDAFYSNTVKTGWDHTKSDTYISAGSKLVRSFKYFVEDKALLETVQNEASRIIQGDCIEGVLCISVHPLDYLSLSENTYNWRSCHALDGEYRAGDLSYLMDKGTFICYLKGDENQRLPDFPEDVLWNSKKWRCLGFMADDYNGIMMGRPYPYEAQDIIEELRWDVFNKKWALNLGSWHADAIRSVEDRLTNWDEELNCTYVPWNGRLVVLDETIHDCPNPTHYNDLLLSSCYLPVYARAKGYFGKRDWKKVQYHIGHEVSCIHCNSDLVSPGDGSMMCHECEIRYGNTESDDIVYCENCGCRMWYEDTTVVGDNGDYLCSECLHKVAHICDDCGNFYYIDDLIYHGPDADHENGFYLCDWCERDREETEANEKEESAQQEWMAQNWNIQPNARPTYYIHDENGQWIPLGRVPEITTSTGTYEVESRNILIQEN